MRQLLIYRDLLLAGIVCVSGACAHFPRLQDVPEKAGRVMKITDVNPDGSLLMPDLLPGKKIARGGLYLFKPGETAHPEARHVHDTDEVFIFVQGKGVLPIDGVEYPVGAGDFVIVKAGEDHHTRSSVEEPLVACWYVMDK